MGRCDNCSVYKCNSRRNLDPGVSFYSFPSKRSRCWLCEELSNRKTSESPKTAKLSLFDSDPVKILRNVGYILTQELGYSAKEDSIQEIISRTNSKTGCNIDKIIRGVTNRRQDSQPRERDEAARLLASRPQSPTVRSRK